jgi:hypothetical protein
MATKAQASKAISILLSAFPNSNRSDGDAMNQFLAILERTLEPYPAEVLAELVNPRTGIISTSTFLPSIAEIKRWCDLKWDKLMPRSVDDRSEEMKQLYGPADVETPEEREARRAIIKQKFKELLADLELATAMNSMRK